MGFCIFNNVAVAAGVALERLDFRRVLIVDWDVHHGNGTQEIFYGENRVLYFSTHQYPYYPGSGHWREIGEGRGEGYTLNVPLPEGTGDDGFRQVWNDVLWPAAEAFRPDLVLISAGYDAHWSDPLAGLALSLEGYAFLARETVRIAEEFAGGRVAVTLEGGYHLDVLSQGVANTLYALLDEETTMDTMGGWALPEPDVNGVVSQVRAYHPLLSLEDA
jgi:acetoin utilization deacetylase AcuC-like enzyme